MIATAVAAVIPVTITTGELAAPATPATTSVQPIDTPPITMVPLNPPVAASGGRPSRPYAALFQSARGTVIVAAPPDITSVPPNSAASSPARQLTDTHIAGAPGMVGPVASPASSYTISQVELPASSVVHSVPMGSSSRPFGSL